MDLRKLKITKNNGENIFCFLVFIFSFLFFPQSFAADSLSYSGRLVKADGSPVAGPVNLTIDLAYTNAPGTILCSQNFSSVVLSNGIFHLKLDLVCPGPPVKTLTEILTAVPSNFAAALRVSDLTSNKIYAFQEIHSMPFATVSESAKQLAQLGAVNGEVLKWNDTNKKWEPSSSGGGGTVTNVTVSAPLAVASGATTPALTISKATTSTDGYLSATDWNVFNNKVGVATGGTTAQYYRGDNSWQTLNSDAVPVGVTNLYFTNALALGVPLGASLDVVNLAGAISSADTILTAFGRTQKQINLINSNASAYVTKTGTSTLAAGTIDAQAGFVLVGAPGSINDATPRGYVDTQVGLKLSKAGDTMSGVLTLNNDLLIKGGSNYVSLKGHASSAAYNFILPSNAGLVGEVLKTDGAGNLSWINPASVAAGSATVDSAAIVNGTIVDADIANTTISYAKFNLSDGDIPLAKLNGVNDATKYLRADKSWQTLNGAAVVNTPAGSIAANTTQAALNELDTEKEAAVTAGLASDYYKGNKTWSNLGTDVRASQLTGLVAGTNTALVATDSILTAFQNTQAQINNKQNAITKLTDQDLKSVRLYGANATNYVELTAGALTANRSLIFPDANGTSGQVLTTNGAGVLSWTTAATTGTAVGGDLTGTIANAQLGAGAVGNAELAADAVTSAKILDGTIVNADLANTTVTYAKLNLTDGDIPLAKLNGASDATKYLRGDKSWSTFATDAIASALAGFTPFATKTDIAAGDSIFTAFQKTQKQLDDIDGDYVSKSGNNTVTGTFNISGITAFLNIPTPNGTTLNEAANVDYVKTYVGTMGQWSKNAANIYFNTGSVGIGTATPTSKFDITGGDITLGTNATYIRSLTPAAAVVRMLGINGLNVAYVGPIDPGPVATMFNTSSTSTDATFYTSGTEKMRINTSGNVGIGTITPGTKLEVNGSVKHGNYISNVLNFVAGGWELGADRQYLRINTTIPWGDGPYVCVSAKGVDYGDAGSIDMQICWYMYSSTFYSPHVTSNGTITPSVSLANESGFVAILLDLGATRRWYHSTLQFDVLYRDTTNTSYFQNWTTSEANFSGTATNIVGPLTANLGNRIFGGKVGIGTTSPDTKLHVMGDAGAGLNNILKISASGNASYLSVFDNAGSASAFDPAFLGYQGVDGGSALQFVGGMDAANDVGTSPMISFQARNGATSGSAVANRDIMDFSNYSTSVMRIKANGKVGIGTTAPSTNLEVVDTSGTTRGITSTTYSTNPGGLFQARGARGTPAAPTSLLTNDTFGWLAFSGYDGTAFSYQGQPTGINSLATENWSATAHGSAVRFNTTPNGSIIGQERVRIDQNGNVGIGTSAPTQALEVNGTVKATNFVGALNGAKFAAGIFSFASGTCNSVGAPCAVNITSGGFSAAPVCTITMINIDATSYTEKMVIHSTTATLLKLWKGNYADAGTSMSGNWICVGP